MAQAFNAMLAESFVAQDFPYWAFWTTAASRIPSTLEETSELHRSLAEDDCSGITTFMELLRENYMGKMKWDKEYAVGYDTTNKNACPGGWHGLCRIRAS